MTARQLIEGAAPVIAPPKPGVKPDKTFTVPSKPKRKHGNPFIRPNIEPGQEPAPKARRHESAGYSRAKALILGESFGSMRHSAPGRNMLNAGVANDAMEQVHERYVQERIHAGMTPEEAEAAWQANRHKFARNFYAPDQEMADRFGLTYRHGHA